MGKKILNSMRGVFVALLLFINMLFFATAVLIVNGLVFLLPCPSLRKRLRAFLQNIPVWWMDANYWILQISTFHKWRVENNVSLNNKAWYLLVSNHQSWMDILVLGIFFRHKIPNLKFFMKRELFWTLPLAGWACYVLDYPFVARHSHEEVRKNPELKNIDIETTRRACDKFKEFPTTIMNFVEGTRFTPQKHANQQSPYRYLLKPKVTGMGLVLNELHRQLSGIINVTIFYKPRLLTLWQFISGDMEQIYLQYELLPITPEIIGDPYTDRIFRKQLQQWLNELWRLKDQQLGLLQEKAL